MTKTKYLLVVSVMLLLMFLSETEVYADAIGSSPLVVGGVLLIIVALIIGVIGLIAWLIIRSIRRKKNGTDK
jgi:hypothetical protein